MAKNNKKWHIEDLKKQKFGRLTVIREAEPKVIVRLKFITFRRKKLRMMECKCDCGKTTTVLLAKLLNGTVRSCGCLLDETRKEFSEKYQLQPGHPVGQYQREIARENARIMGLKNRKYEKKCTYCGKEEHYSHGLCRACYARQRRTGQLDTKEQRVERRLQVLEERQATSEKIRQDRIEQYNPTTEQGELFLIKYKSGMTLNQIALEAGLSRQRVHQILTGK